MISTKTHGYLDFLMGVLFIALPFIIEMPGESSGTILIILGVATILYSLVTDYELGIAKVLSMKAHLGIDLAAGIFLVAAPWIFGFAEDGFWLFVILGIVEVVASLMTAKKPHEERTTNKYNTP